MVSLRVVALSAVFSRRQERHVVVEPGDGWGGSTSSCTSHAQSSSESDAQLSFRFDSHARTTCCVHNRTRHINIHIIIIHGSRPRTHDLTIIRPTPYGRP